MCITASLCYTADWHNTENQLCFNFKNLEQKFSFSVILFSVHISSAQQSQAVRGDHAGQHTFKTFPSLQKSTDWRGSDLYHQAESSVILLETPYRGAGTAKAE